MKPRHFQALRGFTLVELMVVMAIIALLIAALLPALQKAREASLKVQCMSNLRQQGIGIFAFAEDHDGRFPDTGRWGAAWMVAIRHYMGYTDPIGQPTISNHRGGIDGAVPAFRCPQTWTWTGPQTQYYNGTYGINVIAVAPRIFANEVFFKSIVEPYFRTVSTLRNVPSRIYLVSDNYLYSTTGWANMTSATTPGYSHPRHHQWKINTLFMDGHVQLLGRGERRDLFFRDMPDRKPDGWW